MESFFVSVLSLHTFSDDWLSSRSSRWFRRRYGLLAFFGSVETPAGVVSPDSGMISLICSAHWGSNYQSITKKLSGKQESNSDIKTIKDNRERLENGGKVGDGGP